MTMGEVMGLAGILVAAYLAGSLPTAVIMSRLVAGVDVRDLGTGNAGAANVFREVDRRVGVFVAIVDILKGLLPVLVADRFFDLGPTGAVIAAAGALWGHQYSVFLKFRGGAGLASAFGGVAGMMLGPTVVAGFVGLPMLLMTKNMGWTGGITIAIAFGITAISVFTDIQMPDLIAIEDAGYLYGGVLIGLLLALPFWLRKIFELRAARGGDAAPDASSTTEDQT
ncbi:MAG: glycerol-3-phosphate acyltransferase [Dehalococcoidia bacterium]|nr:glycerol-3-phosphate acyltransferase [Dehalococcoidia bacterium]